MITSVRLENFKNFRDATLHLGPFTVIVGANASGKSNLRDAFRFLHGIGRGYSLADIVGEKFVDGVRQWAGIRGGTREIFRHGTSEFAIETQFVPQESVVPANFKYRIRVGSGKAAKPFHILEESYSLGAVEIYSTIDFAAVPNFDTSNLIRVRFWRDNDRVLDPNEEFVEADWPVLAQNLKLDARQILKDMRVMSYSYAINMKSMRFLDLVPDAMKHPSIPGQPLGDRGENLSSVLLSICEDSSRKTAMMEWIRQLTPIDVVDFEFPTDQAGRVLVALKEANGHVTSAYSASDGTLRFLALIAALMAPDAAGFYFLEEIDTGIHPARLHLLVQLIEQFTSRGKVQVVATTHSPQLLSMLSKSSRENACLVYRHEHESDAQLTRIVDIPSAKDVLQEFNLGRLLETGWFENTMDFVTTDAREQ